MQLKEEVVLVISQISDLRQQNSEDAEKDSYSLVGKTISVLVLVIGAILIFGAALLPSTNWLMRPENRQILWVVILFLTTLAAVLLAIDFKKSGFGLFLKDPTGETLKSMGDNLVSYVSLFQELDKLSTEAITHAKDELTRRSKVGHSITGLLVGSLMKVGVLPATISILFTVAKVGENSNNAYVYEICSYMLIALYFVCFRLGEAVLEFEKYSDLWFAPESSETFLSESCGFA